MVYKRKKGYASRFKSAKRRKVAARRRKGAYTKPRNRPRPISKLGTTKRETLVVKESVITASNTASVTYGTQLFILEQLTSINAANTRFTQNIWARGFMFKCGLVNTSSSELYVRLAVVSGKARTAATVFTANNPLLIGQRDPTGTEMMAEEKVSAQSAQNFHSILLDWDMEDISKIHWQKTILLGPTGGLGSKPGVHHFRKYVPINRWQKYEQLDALNIKNGGIFLIAYVVDPSNDTATEYNVEMTYVGEMIWQDTVN